MRSIKQTKWQINEWFKNIFFPKTNFFWLKFEFLLFQKLVVELTGDHFSSSEHIHWQYMGIFPSLHFSGQRLMYWLWCITVTFYAWSPNLKSYLKTYKPSFCLYLCTFELKVKAYPLLLVYDNTYNWYQSPGMLIWQTSCTWKKVFLINQINILFLISRFLKQFVSTRP